MTDRKIGRDATTAKGYLRRLSDADFTQISDPRRQASVLHPLAGLLRLAILALASGARSTRAVEDRSEQLRGTVRRAIGCPERISDNAFGLLLPRLCHSQLRRSLHRYVKAEWRRRRLRPEEGPLERSTVAIDGKHVATIPERRLRALVTDRTDLDGEALSAEELRRVLGTQFPYLQLQEGEDRLVGLMRVHRATLVSSPAAVVIDQWPLRGETNEAGTIEQTLRGLFEAYGPTRIVQMVTMDAGNATPEAAKLCRQHAVDYFMAIKSPQGALYREAVARLGGRTARQAADSVGRDQRGRRICHTVWLEAVDTPHGWRDASTVVRIERVVVDDEGHTEVGNRYFVCSVPVGRLEPAECLALARAHWRCENEGHWTADAIWEEDARRTPWTQHPDGVLVAGLLRALAINILAVLRALSCRQRGRRWVRPTWKTAIEQTLLVLFRPLLDMEAFNAFED